MKKRSTNENGIVFSTEFGKMCPDCFQPIKACICKQQKPIEKGDGIVRIGHETKGRKGKGVTTITGLALNQVELKKLSKHLKSQCSSGGTIKEGTIEIQGDHRPGIAKELEKKGWTVKLTGG